MKKFLKDSLHIMPTAAAIRERQDPLFDKAVNTLYDTIYEYYFETLFDLEDAVSSHVVATFEIPSRRVGEAAGKKFVKTMQAIGYKVSAEIEAYPDFSSGGGMFPEFLGTKYRLSVDVYWR